MPAPPAKGATALQSLSPAPIKRDPCTKVDAPEAEQVVWLFSLVLGHSRMMWARFVTQQDLATVLRCHVAAFEALGGVPEQILYDRMKTAVLGERTSAASSTTTSSSRSPPTTASCPRLPALRAKTKGKSRGPSATSARTSSSPAASAASTT
jgi:transposase